MKLSISNIKDFAEVLVSAVKTAEALWSDYDNAGPLKRDWVVSLINDKVNIPYLHEALEAKLIGLLVDLVVELILNR